MPFNLKKPNVMIDLETVSTYADAGILSIGAVKFDETGILDEFYVNVKFSAIKNYDLHTEASTLRWWKEQNEAARKALFKDAKPLEDSLHAFRTWFGRDSLVTWSKGASFDNAILPVTFRKVAEVEGYDPDEFKVPFKFWDGLCARTVFEMFKEFNLEPDRVGTAHNALDDAKHQALWMINCWKAWTM